MSTDPATAHIANERLQDLQQQIASNIAGGRSPCEGVDLSAPGEISWLMQHMNWSGAPESTHPINLAGANLDDLDLRGFVMNGANLTSASLNRAKLDGAELDGALLVGASLIKASMRGARIGWTDFKTANLMNADLSQSFIAGANFQDAILVGATLNGSQLDGSNLAGATLNGAELRGASLMNADLSGASISQAVLDAALLGNAVLKGVFADGSSFVNGFLGGVRATGASLISANLSGADLTHADIADASLRGANCRGATLIETDLRGADLREVVFDVSSKFADVQLSGETKLGDVIWGGVPLIRVDWERIPRLGDEREVATVKRQRKGILRRVHREKLAKSYRDAARANHVLALALKDQGIGYYASAYRLREKQLSMMARKAERRYLEWLGSVVLDLISGFGERPGRIILTYLFVVGMFSVFFYAVSGTSNSGIHSLAWNEALVLSLTSFHGRGFFPASIGLGDFIALVAALEAVIGLFIELILLGTFSKRYLED